MKVNLSLRQKTFLLILFALACELIFGLFMMGRLARSQASVERERHVREVISHLDRLSLAQQNLTLEVLKDVVVAGSADPEDYELYKADILREINDLKALVAAEPESLEKVGEIESLLKQTIKLMDECLHNFLAHPSPLGMMRYENRIGALTHQATFNSKELLENYSKLEEVELATQHEERHYIAIVLVSGLVLNVLFVVLFAFRFTQDFVRRLENLSDNSMRLGAGMPLQPVLAGTDEIAKVDSAFHHMAETLAEMAQKERATIENALDFICSIDTNEMFSAANPYCHKLLGYAPDELIGRRFIDLVEDSARATTRESLKEAIDEKRGVTFESLLNRKDNSAVTVLWSARWSPEQQELFCVIHDISERKRTENKIRSILQYQPIGIITLKDRSGLIESVNERIETLFKKDAKELVGENVRTLFALSDTQLKLPFEEDPNAAAQINPTQTIELTGICPDGSFQAELSFSQFEGVDGERFLVNVQDITERRELERIKEQFIYMVSHDLRTPITSVHGMLTMVEEGMLDPLSDLGKRCLSEATKASGRVIDLVNDLLDLDRMKAGKLVLEMTQVKVSTIVEIAIETIEVFANQRQVPLVDKTQEAILLADQGRIAQVLTNLVSNAVKFSAPGQTVEISTHIEPGLCELRITDQGPGIAPEYTEVIFQQFKQLPGEQAKSGSGLGLAICREIVECHQGEIGVRSEKGKGSTFWFKLPSLTPATNSPDQQSREDREPEYNSAS